MSNHRGPASDAITDFFYFAPPGSGQRNLHVKVGLPKYQIRRNKLYKTLDKINAHLKTIQQQAPVQQQAPAPVPAWAQVPIQFAAPVKVPVPDPIPLPRVVVPLREALINGLAPGETIEEEVNLREPQYMAQIIEHPPFEVPTKKHTPVFPHVQIPPPMKLPVNKTEQIISVMNWKME